MIDIISSQSPLSSEKDCCIAVFVKAPHPGQVKTRLGQSIGHGAAAQLYQCFAEDVLSTVDTLGVSSQVFVAPPEDLAKVQQWLGVARTYQLQQGIDLGDRMAHAFRTSFDLGYKRVLILGSDSPDLPQTYLIEAFQALAQNQVVIGPSTDGGYYTLGFTPQTFCPEVFQNMPWSSPNVLAQTLAVLNHQQQQVHCLPTWSDIDTLEDLEKFYQHHQAQPDASLSMAYLRDHADVLFPVYGTSNSKS